MAKTKKRPANKAKNKKPPANEPTWRALPIAEALDDEHDASPAVLTTLKNFGVNTCGELADRLKAEQTFGLTLVDRQALCESIELMSADDPEPVKFNDEATDLDPTKPEPSEAEALMDAGGLALVGVSDDRAEPTGPFTAEELAAYDADTVRMVSQAEDRAKSAESTYENSKAVASEDKKRYEARVDELRKLIHDRADNRGKRPQKTLLDHVPVWRLRNVTAIALAFDGAKDAVEIALGAGIKTLGDLYEQIGPDHTQATTTLWTAEVIEQLRAAVQKYIDAETAEAPPAAPELWREFPIDRWTQFGLTSKDVEKLHSGEAKGGGGHPIITVGDLNRFVTPNPANPSYARGYGDIKGIGSAGVDRISEAETKFWSWWKGGGEAEFAAERAPKPDAEVNPEPAEETAESEAA